MLLCRLAVVVHLASLPLIQGGVLSDSVSKCAGARFEDHCIDCDGVACRVLKHTEVLSSPDDCCAECQKHEGCDFWTYDKNMSTCFMKAGTSLVRHEGSCDSGLKQLPVPAPSPAPPAPSSAKNVLLIVVDDMRPDIGAYGASHMQTPHMDKLAATGTLFQRAYVQYSVCAPSRNSFMTGRRPDKTQAWSFTTHFRERGIGEDWVTMPQYFREHGYLTLAAGKLFHPALPPNFDAPKSFDFLTNPGKCTGSSSGWPVLEDNVTNVDCPPATDACDAEATIEGDVTHWCKLNTTLLKQPLADDITVDVTVSNLRLAKAAGKPFFIAAGFHKPHAPFMFPAEYDIYPPASEIAPPKHQLPPKDMPLCAWHEGGFASHWDKPCNHPGEFRRAYYSAVSYTDGNIGKVLAALDELGLTDDTAVALISDHGYQLGEMNLWHKMTNFELGVRVPLIIRAPWAHKSAGTKTPALAEAVDLYPTLVELAGLPVVPASEGLQGLSLAGIIADPPSQGTGARSYAFSQFAKSSMMSDELGRNEYWDTCHFCEHSSIEVMGYSIRSDNWRLTEWVHWDQEALVPLWDQQEGLELYDHKDDFGEDLDRASPTKNLAFQPENKKIVSELRRALREHFNDDHLPRSWMV